MSTCHWCHVMERESFEDEEVAELINRDFVPVKVDREERPDIDHLYMAVCQAMTGHGGWPLTVILTPDGKPFFAGTYFPKREKFGRYGLMDILPQIAEKWRKERGGVLTVSANVAEYAQRRLLEGKAGEPDRTWPDQAFEMFDDMFDPRYGGFGNAPKFPAAHNLMFLLRYAALKGNEYALEMAETTLEAMHRGGMYDHIGFGFARYSTDREWLVPHFEKMLYDNALLAIAYTEAHLITGKPLYREVAEQILSYVTRDMTDPEGGFYSAEDADSEGEEGKFYVWTPDEVLETLGDRDGEWFCRLYGITEEGNFEGSSIPNLLGHTFGQFAEKEGVSEGEVRERAEALRRKLFAAREKRVRPGKDDKILTAWNGLMIAAFAIAARAFGREDYREAAERAASFVLAKLRRPDGRLLARWRDGEAAYPAYLDDYACMVWALIELYETTFDAAHLDRALELNREMIRLFRDEERGGFFFYGHDAEKLIAPVKETFDGAMPSGNSLAAWNLIRLARLTGDGELEALFEKHLESSAGAISRYPAGHAMFLTAMLHAYEPGREIVIAGDREDPQTGRFIAAIHRMFLPNMVVMLHSPGAEGEAARRLMPVIADKTPVEGKTAVYVCEHYACQAPVTEPGALTAMLKGTPLT